MDIQVRPAHAADMPRCVDLFLNSLKDMRARHNLPGVTLPSASEMLLFYQHVLATGTFHVVDSGMEIAALACAILRDQLWFLSGFWASPGLQRQRVGMPVLRSVWEAGRKAGATHFFVWASVDVTAVAAYMKMGMLPGCQILSFEGLPQRLIPPAPHETIEPLDPSFAMALDETVRGTRRAVDHAFFASTGSQGRQVRRDGQRIGYYYLDAGRIGPAAWTDPEHAQVLLAAALREATTGIEATAGQKVFVEVPGMNHAALRFALESGLRLQGSSNLLMSAPFGRLEQYLPSGPGLF
ncbi:MAG: hypothetical protein V1755_11325 [Chloroflexota bacterium]